MEKAPGRNFIKVPGIILIIFASFELIIGAIVLVGGIAVVAAGASLDLSSDGIYLDPKIIGAIAIALSAIPLIIGLVQLSFGISGVRNCNKPKKAGRIKGIGICLIILQLLSTGAGIGFNWISNTIGFGEPVAFFTPEMYSSLVIGLLLGIFYIIGASLNKSAR